MKKSIVIAGFSGTGKSTIGRLTAQRSGSAFIDTDAKVINLTKKSIKSIFADEGEAHFRKLEAEICVEAANSRNTVIATGGGALLNPDTKQAFLDHCVVINLSASLFTIQARMLSDRRRPLLKDRREIQKLYASRATLYNSLPHQIVVEGKTPLVIADELIKLWNLVG